jgi:cardiolipin synthase
MLSVSPGYPSRFQERLVDPIGISQVVPQDRPDLERLVLGTAWDGVESLGFGSGWNDFARPIWYTNTMEQFHWATHGIFVADLLIRLGLSARVIQRRLPVGVSLAWLAIILILPFVGAILYLLVGEYRLGPRRAKRAAAYQATGDPRWEQCRDGDRVDPATLDAGAAAVARLAETALGGALLAGNHLELLENADAAFPALIADIDRARQSCDLEFYIWDLGGRADDVGAALIRAVRRGVTCRVLVDAIGSKTFLKSALARDLRQNGVQVAAALRAGALRLLFRRPDLRLHRKIAVIDGAAAYTGSLNLADPHFFKREAGVGQWVDALVRVQGPAVEALAATFREDWALETGQSIQPVTPAASGQVPPQPGSAVVQVLPTGPDARVEAIEQVVLMALYAAAREVVLTTSYFVPSESLLIALLSAAGRGVQVTLIVPAKVDSRLVHFASRAYQTDLLAAGVRVALYEGGLLHTKSITVDGRFSLFGSLNLDPRSLRLDFEITLAVYDADFTAALRRLQQVYLDRSSMLDLTACRARSTAERLAEDTARLAGPVL